MTRLILGTLLLSAIVACGGDANNHAGTCGDGHVDTGEQCDDGNTSNGDGCSSTCKTEGTSGHCGDGVVDVGAEQCDDGNTANGDGCSSTCHTECGNGMLDGTEACDDGNTAAGDGCSATCTVEPGYTCSGEPSDCTAPTGTCAAPFVLALADNNGTLEGAGSGDTTTGTNQVAATDCDGMTSGGANDHIWQFTIPDRRDVTITIADTTPFDAVLRLFAAPCDHATEIPEYQGADGCSDYGLAMEGEGLMFIGLPAGTYYVVVDGYDTPDVGHYDVTVSAAPSTCGNGTIEGFEGCDDANTTSMDGCTDRCDVELGYTCSGAPSVCVSACGNGQLDAGEECDDGGTVDGDRCSATCTLEYDVAEVEDNNTVPQPLTATNHIIKGSLTAGDVDLYTFTLTAPATVELETYDAMDPGLDYNGVGANPLFDCLSDDTQLRIFDATGDVTMNDTALAFDDDDGADLCSYVGPHDAANAMEGMLPAGTYTIKINDYSASGTDTRYLLDLKITTTTPVPPLAGDLVLNEYMAADNSSDTNCDGSTTGTNDEFVELVNVSNKILDLTGVTIADSVIVRHTFAATNTGTGSLTLQPGKAIVVWGGGAPACPGVTNFFVASTGQLGLNDAGDTITVKNADGLQLVQRTFGAATLNLADNLSPDVTGTIYVHHNMVTGAVGNYSPGKHVDGTAF